MQIELIGCTGAGKSTLARGIVQAGREHGIDTVMGEEIVLNQVRLNWVKTKLARTLCVDLITLFACLVAWQKNLEFYRFTIRVLARLPVGWFEKLNIARNVFKKIGINEIVLHVGSQQQIVLLDEGTLHTAHYLFVHVSVEPDTNDLSNFIKLVPLPDVVIYVRHDETILIQRTLVRGHKRIPNNSFHQVELFVRNAVETFDNLVQKPVIESRLLVVDGERKITIAKDYLKDPLRAGALDIIRDGIDAVSPNYPERSVHASYAKIPRPHRNYQSGE